jgi:hypothetical protein
MAYNNYNQRSQAQPSRGQYQGPPQQNGWSNGGGQHYENGYQQQQGYNDWDYSQQVGDQYGYRTDRNQYGESANDHPVQSSSQPDGQYYDQQQYNQQYQYDPRYRSQGQASNIQPDRRQDRGERQGREKHRPQEMDLKGKSKCR